jgi:Na+/glutamate symporter
MKKTYFSLTGFIILISINYILSNYTEQDITENLNNIDFYKIIKQSLQPQLVFLLIIFFSRENIKAPIFSMFMFGYIIIEFILRYFNGKEIIEYNYAIGMALGIILVFVIESLKEKFIIKGKQIKNDN